MQKVSIITEKIIKDAKIELLKKIELLNKKEPSLNSSLIEALINQGKEVSEKFQNDNPNNYFEVKSFYKNREKMLLGISSQDKTYLLNFFDRRTAAYESEGIFYFVNGVKNGVAIYSTLMDVAQGKATFEDLSKFFYSKYWDTDIYEIYMALYGKEYKLDKLSNFAESIMESPNISESEYDILSDYLLDADYIQCECKYLYEHGLSLGLKLAYDATSR